MKRIDGSFALDGEQLFDELFGAFDGIAHIGVRLGDRAELVRRQIISDSIRTTK